MVLNVLLVLEAVLLPWPFWVVLFCRAAEVQPSGVACFALSWKRFYYLGLFGCLFSVALPVVSHLLLQVLSFLVRAFISLESFVLVFLWPS